MRITSIFSNMINDNINIDSSSSSSGGEDDALGTNTPGSNRSSSSNNNNDDIRCTVRFSSNGGGFIGESGGGGSSNTTSELTNGYHEIGLEIGYVKLDNTDRCVFRLSKEPEGVPGGISTDLVNTYRKFRIFLAQHFPPSFWKSEWDEYITHGNYYVRSVEAKIPVEVTDTWPGRPGPYYVRKVPPQVLQKDGNGGLIQFIHDDIHYEQQQERELDVSSRRRGMSRFTDHIDMMHERSKKKLGQAEEEEEKQTKNDEGIINRRPDNDDVATTTTTDALGRPYSEHLRMIIGRVNKYGRNEDILNLKVPEQMDPNEVCTYEKLQDFVRTHCCCSRGEGVGKFQKLTSISNYNIKFMDTRTSKLATWIIERGERYFEFRNVVLPNGYFDDLNVKTVEVLPVGFYSYLATTKATTATTNNDDDTNATVRTKNVTNVSRTNATATDDTATVTNCHRPRAQENSLRERAAFEPTATATESDKAISRNGPTKRELSKRDKERTLRSLRQHNDAAASVATVASTNRQLTEHGGNDLVEIRQVQTGHQTTNPKDATKIPPEAGRNSVGVKNVTKHPPGAPKKGAPPKKKPPQPQQQQPTQIDAPGAPRKAAPPKNTRKSRNGDTLETPRPPPPPSPGFDETPRVRNTSDRQKTDDNESGEDIGNSNSDVNPTSGNNDPNPNPPGNPSAANLAKRKRETEANLNLPAKKKNRVGGKDDGSPSNTGNGNNTAGSNGNRTKGGSGIGDNGANSGDDHGNSNTGSSGNSNSCA